MKKRIALCAITLFLTLFFSSSFPVRGEGGSVEYQVKAAFLLNFAKFMAWPESSFAQEESVFKICVIGENPFGAILGALEKKTVRGRPIRVFYAEKLNTSKGYHLAFISGSEEGQIAELLASLEKQPVITVSDMKGFARKGGVVEFVQQNGRLSFIINLVEAGHQKVDIQAALLNVAKEVITEGR